MCGRYTLSLVDGGAIAARFGTAEPPVRETLERCNVCPTEPIAVVVGPATAPRMATLTWGIRPRRNPSSMLINARSESAGANGLWRSLLRDGRCLVVADGWYEWLKAEKPGPPRLPFRYTGTLPKSENE